MVPCLVILFSAVVTISAAPSRTHISVSEGQNVAKITFIVLESLRNEANFTLFNFGVIKLEEEDLDVMEPRKRKRPAHYEAGNVEAELHETVECQYRQNITKQLTQLSAPYKTVSIKMDTRLA